MSTAGKHNVHSVSTQQGPRAPYLQQHPHFTSCVEAHHKQIFVVVVANEHILPATVWDPGRPSYFGQSTHHDVLCRADKQKGQFPSPGGKGGESLLQQADSQLWLAGFMHSVAQDNQACRRFATTQQHAHGRRMQTGRSRYG